MFIKIVILLICLFFVIRFSSNDIYVKVSPDETKFDMSKEINLNCVLNCPCRENRFTQANIGISASEIPKHSLSGLLFFQTNC